MASSNDIKEELSYAYLHAVAAAAGFTVSRPGKDRDSVDAVVEAKDFVVYRFGANATGLVEGYAVRR